MVLGFQVHDKATPTDYISTIQEFRERWKKANPGSWSMNLGPEQTKTFKKYFHIRKWYSKIEESKSDDNWRAAMGANPTNTLKLLRNVWNIDKTDTTCNVDLDETLIYYVKVTAKTDQGDLDNDA